jgi:hypothetical protein
MIALIWFVLIWFVLAVLASLFTSKSRLGRRMRFNVTAKPDSGVDCTPAHRGISLGWGSALYDPGPRSDLQRHCHTPSSRHGHPR